MAVSVCQRYRWCVHETRTCQEVQTNNIRAHTEAEGTKCWTWFVTTSTVHKTRVSSTFGEPPKSRISCYNQRGETPPDDVTFRAAAWIGDTSLLPRALRSATSYRSLTRSTVQGTVAIKRASSFPTSYKVGRSHSSRAVARAISVECSHLETSPREHVRRGIFDPDGLWVVLHPHFPLGHRHISGVPYDDHTPSQHGRRAR